MRALVVKYGGPMPSLLPAPEWAKTSSQRVPVAVAPPIAAAADAAASVTAPTTVDGGGSSRLRVGQNVSIYWKKQGAHFEGTIKSVQIEESASGDDIYKINVEYSRSADKRGAPVGTYSHSLPAWRHVREFGTEFCTKACRRSGLCLRRRGGDD